MLASRLSDERCLSGNLPRIRSVQPCGTNLAPGHCGPVRRHVAFPSSHKEKLMNMRHTVLHATAISIALAALPVLAQQTETTETPTKTTGKQGNHEYVYYGDHDIYFAPETRTYYWQEG